MSESIRTTSKNFCRYNNNRIIDVGGGQNSDRSHTEHGTRHDKATSHTTLTRRHTHTRNHMHRRPNEGLRLHGQSRTRWSPGGVSSAQHVVHRVGGLDTCGEKRLRKSLACPARGQAR